MNNISKELDTLKSLSESGLMPDSFSIESAGAIKKLIADCSNYCAETKEAASRDDVFYCGVNKIDDAVNLLRLVSRFFAAEDGANIFRGLMSSSDALQYEYYCGAYIEILYELLYSKKIGEKISPIEDWIKSEAVLSNSGMSKVYKNSYCDANFSDILKSLISIHGRSEESEFHNNAILEITGDRIEAMLFDLISDLDSEPLKSIRFQDPFSRSLISPSILSGISALSESIISLDSGNEARRTALGKIIRNICNGFCGDGYRGADPSFDDHLASHFRSVIGKTIDKIVPHIDWAHTLEGITDNGKIFLINYSSRGHYFEKYLDKKSRAALLRNDLSL